MSYKNQLFFFICFLIACLLVVGIDIEIEKLINAKPKNSLQERFEIAVFSLFISIIVASGVTFLLTPFFFLRLRNIGVHPLISTLLLIPLFIFSTWLFVTLQKQSLNAPHPLILYIGYLGGIILLLLLVFPSKKNISQKEKNTKNHPQNPIQQISKRNYP